MDDAVKVKDGADKAAAKDSVQETGRNLFDDVANKFAAAQPANDDAGQKAAAAAAGKPAGISVVPPFMLQELARRNPNNKAFADTLNKTNEMLVPEAPVPNATNDNGSREVYDAQEKEEHPGVKARFEGEGAHTDPEVNDTYDFAGATRDFYKDVLGRNSIDDTGMKMVSTVNYGKSYENAFWNGSQMTYGRPGADSPFKTFVLMDVAGHEVTHGVTEKVSGMRYYGQSGALNESMSDVMGELIQQKAKGIAAKDADWILGDGIWKDGINGKGLRNMMNPGTAYDDPKVGKDPQPGHMKDYVQTWGDNGGVHYNSGIPNRAFATFAVAVGGNAWETPGKIWYEALKNTGTNPSFAQFAQSTLDAAAKLGHQDQVDKLKKAWEDVGVVPSATATDTITPGARQQKAPESDTPLPPALPEKKVENTGKKKAA